jgi:hypothetical protein
MIAGSAEISQNQQAKAATAAATAVQLLATAHAAVDRSCALPLGLAPSEECCVRFVCAWHAVASCACHCREQGRPGQREHSVHRSMLH